VESPPPITELHCHVLPGVDDGPATMADALALAEALVADGVRRVVATPHVSRSMPTSAATMRERVSALRAALDERGLDLEVLPGAEIAADMLVDLPPEELGALTLGSSSWVLLEAPIVGEFPIEVAVETLRERGLRALMAHPERCALFQRAPDRLEALVAAGARGSVTSGALAGAFGTLARRVAFQLVEADLIHNAVSDAHDIARRPPRMVADLERAGLAARTAEWCAAFPAALLGGAAEPTRRAPAANAPDAPSPSVLAARMLADGIAPDEVERALMREVPPTVARRIVARTLRSQAAAADI
jgi:protein-tyrosine phosphatase